MKMLTVRFKSGWSITAPCALVDFVWDICERIRGRAIEYAENKTES